MKEPWELTWRDYYADLALTEEACDDDIRIAFRALAREHHPDRFAASPTERFDAEQRFKRIAEAYEILRTPARRSAYDDARSRSINGLAPLADVSVEPPNVELFSLNGDLVVRSHVTFRDEGAVGLLSIDCDNADVLLLGADVGPCRHGQPDVYDAIVRARVERGMHHRVVLEYSVERTRATQNIEARVLPMPFLWLGRLHAKSGWPALLGATGLLTLLVTPFAFSAGTALGAVVLGAAIAMGVLSVGALLLRFFRTPGWSKQLVPKGGWAFVVVIIVVINLARMLLGFLS